MSSTDGNPGTGVGVLDKAMSIVAALEQGPAKLAELTEATGMSRATVHRLASSLDDHGLLRRTADGSFALGYRLVGLAALALSDSALADTARPVVTRLRDVTGESAQLWLPDGEWRVCVVSVEATHELRTIVGEEPACPSRLVRGAGAVGCGRTRGLGRHRRGACRWRGFGLGAGEGAGATVVAAVGISGPVDRIGVDPGASYGTHVLQAAAELSLAVGGRRHG